MTRPTVIQGDAAAIPDALKAERRWVCWRYLWSKHEGKQGRWIKLPCEPTGRAAKPNNASTWTSFGEVLGAAGRFDGIGFCLGDGWAGIDLDDCVDPSGDIIPDTLGMVARLELKRYV